MLTEKQFDLLSLMAQNDKSKISQREMSRQTGYSLGTINSIITNLEEEKRENLATVREIISGGGPLHRKIWKKFINKKNDICSCRSWFKTSSNYTEHSQAPCTHKRPENH